MTLELLIHQHKTTASSTLAIGGVSSPLDSFVVNQTLVFQIKFCGKSPALRVAAKRVCHASTNNYQYIYHKKNLIQKHITNESNK
jgi:hypothetical protein